MFPVNAHTITPDHAIREKPAGTQARRINLNCFRLNTNATNAGRNHVNKTNAPTTINNMGSVVAKNCDSASIYLSFKRYIQVYSLGIEEKITKKAHLILYIAAFGNSCKDRF